VANELPVPLVLFQFRLNVDVGVFVFFVTGILCFFFAFLLLDVRGGRAPLQVVFTAFLVCGDSR